LGRRSIVSWFRRQAVGCLPEASTIRAIDETLGVRPTSIAVAVGMGAAIAAILRLPLSAVGAPPYR